MRDPAWLPSGKLLRAVSFGQRLLLADVYWLETVQYVGETVLAKAVRWDALYPLGEIVTDLDPRFGYAYQITGSNLAGLAHRYPEAERILKKGMRNLPDRWSLYFAHATNKFLYEQDYAEAAKYARLAAQIGKKPHLALLAANLSALVDSDAEYGAAIAFLDESLAATDTAELRDELVARRTRIQTFQALSRLERAIAGFRARTGRVPWTLDELVPIELPELPGDPSGGELQYDPSTGRVKRQQARAARASADNRRKAVIALTIASATVREALRERLLHNLLVFAVLLVVAALTISQLTLGEQFRIIANVGLSATQIFGTLIAVFLGVGLVSRELDRRTCYPVLARPVSRAGFVAGKYLGLLATLALNVALMSVATALVLAFYEGSPSWFGAAYLATFFLTFVQLAVCAAFAVLFSTFSTATLASIYTLAIVGAGWLFGEVRWFWLQAQQTEMKGLVKVLDYVLPNMTLLDSKEALVYGDPITLASVAGRASYGLAYAATLVAFATLVFTKRDVR
ncbi:MAG: ABC transporter permease [Anaeromyxobacteraceae bacterium]